MMSFQKIDEARLTNGTDEDVIFIYTINGETRRHM